VSPLPFESSIRGASAPRTFSPEEIVANALAALKTALMAMLTAASSVDT